jgi:hypothetical protein
MVGEDLWVNWVDFCARWEIFLSESGGYSVFFEKRVFKNSPFFHFLRRFSAFLREIKKNNAF